MKKLVYTIKLFLYKKFFNDFRMAHGVPDFAHQNKDLLVIICDPKSDNIFVAYNDALVSGRIKSIKTNKKAFIVRNVLKFSKFKSEVDGFLGALVETLHLPVEKGNDFLQFLDGALYNISRNLRSTEKSTPTAAPPSSNSGAVGV